MNKKIVKKKKSNKKKKTSKKKINKKIENFKNQIFSLNRKHLIAILILSLLITTLIISSIKLIKWKIDSKEMEEQVEKINKEVKVEEQKDSDNTEVVKTNENQNNPYWKYIQMNLINVDFGELKSTNKDVKGWIQVNGTNINYPFVQTKDNSYYLTHAFNKSYNDAGWIFLDYRNSSTSYDKNTILYGHSRLDKTMFGSLRKALTNGWLNNTNNYVIKLSTEYENTLWQVFSVYHIPTTSDYLQITFNDNVEFKNFANMLLKRSAHNFKTSVNENDKILTLSTCYNDNEKMVIHAKLIKSSKR